NAANLNGNIQGFEANLALADGGNDLVLVVVPEPGSMGLLAAAGLLLGLRRYRRNQFMAKGLKNVIHPYGKGF
ncbi:MAG: PEP-CTERM sorting domain-containing protein, partial [Verrucomicrobiota bacterium]